MKLREALELLKDFDQEHEVHFVTPADPGDGPTRLILVSADGVTTSHPLYTARVVLPGGETP